MKTNKHPRTHPTEEFKNKLEESKTIRLFVLQEPGPTKFVIEDIDQKQFRIQIGNTIKCSCGGGITEHCVHTVRFYLLQHI